MSILSPAVAPVAFSSSQMDAEDVLRPGCAMWVWRRALRAPVSTFAAQVAGEMAFHVRDAFAVAERHGAIAALLDPLALPQGTGREVFLGDVASLVHLLGRVTGAERVRLRVEADPGAGCPLFHVDSVGLRLLCTYAGPGTEWLAPGAADLSELGLRGRSPERANAAIAVGPVRRLEPGWVALMKGRPLLGAFDAPAVVHRSPSPELGRRLLVVADVEGAA